VLRVGDPVIFIKDASGYAHRGTIVDLFPRLVVVRTDRELIYVRPNQVTRDDETAQGTLAHLSIGDLTRG